MHGIGDIKINSIIFIKFVGPSSWNNSAPNGRLSRNFIFYYFSKNLWTQFKLNYNVTIITRDLDGNISLDSS